MATAINTHTAIDNYSDFVVLLTPFLRGLREDKLSLKKYKRELKRLEKWKLIVLTTVPLCLPR